VLPPGPQGPSGRRRAQQPMDRPDGGAGRQGMTTRRTKGGRRPGLVRGMPGAGLTRRGRGKAPPDMPAFQPYWGKSAVRKDRGDDGTVGIIRSPVRAIVLPDWEPRAGDGPGPPDSALNDGAGWCADAPAKVSGSPPSSASTDKVDRFVAQPSPPPPASCAPLPRDGRSSAGAGFLGPRGLAPGPGVLIFLDDPCACSVSPLTSAVAANGPRNGRGSPWDR
jgi:hypothetical protein